MRVRAIRGSLERPRRAWHIRLDSGGWESAWFGPVGRVDLAPPVTLELARRIKQQIDEGIRQANEALKGEAENG